MAPEKPLCICEALRDGSVMAPGLELKCPVHKKAFVPPKRHFEKKSAEDAYRALRGR